MSTTAEHFEQYPCRVPIKVIGRGDVRFELEILQILEHHAPDFDPRTIQRRASRDGNYTAVTAMLTANSREQLHAIYRDIQRCPGFVMAL